MENSKIEWTKHTFNPWSGCTKVSAGCKFCYAEKLSEYTNIGKWGPHAKRIVTSPAYWKRPYKWDKEAARTGTRDRVFCASLADVFEDRPELADPRERLFEVIRDTQYLDWLLLTKRPENILRLTPSWFDYTLRENVWVGTSVENQETADTRIPYLLQVPAQVRFLSMEPLLGPVQLRMYRQDEPGNNVCKPDSGWLPYPNNPDPMTRRAQYQHGINWIIVGGESGPKARIIQLDWVRSLRDQAAEARVPFFFKQWGTWCPASQIPDRDPAFLDLFKDETTLLKTGKKAAGRSLDGRIHDEVPIRHR